MRVGTVKGGDVLSLEQPVVGACRLARNRAGAPLADAAANVASPEGAHPTMPTPFSRRVAVSPPPHRGNANVEHVAAHRGATTPLRGDTALEIGHSRFSLAYSRKTCYGDVVADRALARSRITSSTPTTEGCRAGRLVVQLAASAITATNPPRRRRRARNAIVPANGVGVARRARAQGEDAAPAGSVKHPVYHFPLRVSAGATRRRRECFGAGRAAVQHTDARWNRGSNGATTAFTASRAVERKLPLDFRRSCFLAGVAWSSAVLPAALAKSARSLRAQTPNSQLPLQAAQRCARAQGVQLRRFMAIEALLAATTSGSQTPYAKQQQSAGFGYAGRNGRIGHGFVTPGEGIEEVARAHDADPTVVNAVARVKFDTEIPLQPLAHGIKRIASSRVTSENIDSRREGSWWVWKRQYIQVIDISSGGITPRWNCCALYSISRSTVDIYYHTRVCGPKLTKCAVICQSRCLAIVRTCYIKHYVPPASRRLPYEMTWTGWIVESNRRRKCGRRSSSNYECRLPQTVSSNAPHFCSPVGSAKVVFSHFVGKTLTNRLYRLDRGIAIFMSRTHSLYSL